MRRLKTPFFVMLCLGFCGAWIASCKDDDDGACVPQETRICAGIGRCEGVEVCLPDGSGYGACDCSGPMRGGMAGSMNEPAGTTPLVGRACADDAACGAGLTCITSSSNEFLGGGPGNGYCTLPCTSDAECTSIDGQSQCVASNVAGTSGLCLRTCLSQDPRTVDENKCLGRRDVVCQSEAYLGLAMFSGNRQRGWCYPQCGSDDDCAGRRCDLARGICVDTPTAGLPIGAKCAADVDCAGRLCIGLAGGESLCSAPCVFGQRLGCGDGLSGPRTAGCAAVQMAGFLSEEGIGDVGYCVELCGQSSECEQAASGNWQCEPIADIAQRFSAAGICDAPDLTDGGVDGGAGEDASTPSVGDAG